MALTQKMKLMITCFVLLACGAARAQSLISSMKPSQPGRLLTSDAAVLDLQEPRNDLTCSVSPSKPELGFDFLFHTGYQVRIPLAELTGGPNLLTIILRVRSEMYKVQPIYLLQKFRVPVISEDSWGNTVLDGAFRVGEGKYHVDWLMRDTAGRICARFWDVEARATGKDMPLSQRLSQDLIQPVESSPFDEQDPVEHQPIGGNLSVKIIINFAPQRLEAAALGHEDLQGLVAILRKIGREPCIGRFSVVACSLQAQKVIYRQRNGTRLDLSALGEALKQLNLASVDAKQLALKNGETEFLTRLIIEETREDPLDGLIFVSPKYFLDVNVSREIIGHLRGFDHAVFYLNYSLDPSLYPWRDAIGCVVKQMRGFEYTISRPLDLFNAWSDIMSHILNVKRPAGNMGTRQ